VIERTGELIREQRKAAKLTQKQLAEKAGVDLRTLERLESGDSEKPQSDTIRHLAKALGIPYNFLLGREFDRETRQVEDLEYFDPLDPSGIGRFL
jgi:transcriptional regulator with XRE-family HTH domain